MIENQKKIWITGASSGIGKALALKFAEENWQVAISARRKELLDELAQNVNISSFPLDVTNDNSVNTAFSNILNEFSNLDLCVFCSGAYDPKLEKEINKEQIKKIMNINFFGVLNCIKTVEEYFKNKKEGHISIVSSVAAYRGLPNSSGYGPSKAALTNLTESLYFDFKKHNVRISLISPGFIKTPLTNQNTFNMPFIKTPTFAANKIYNGLIKSNAFEIHFPKELTVFLKFLRILPYRIYLFLINKFVKRD
jgi:NAD(P)-dependent dehydrogenase (short-subunit alcohol dehydrogenase family)|tara:strand:+ start:642 stop:1397 length:756 start_codon:yes stop_codon:yes gene_type:complete